MRQNELILFVVSIFIVVVAWIGFNIYHSHTTSTISEVVKIEIRSISPDFDTKTVEKIKGRTKIEPIFDIQKPAETILLSPPLSPSATPSSPLTPGTLSPTQIPSP